MKSKLDPQTTPEQKFARFTNALRTVLGASKTDLNQMLADEKIAKRNKKKPGPKPRRRSSASGHASDSGA